MGDMTLARRRSRTDISSSAESVVTRDWLSQSNLTQSSFSFMRCDSSCSNSKMPSFFLLSAPFPHTHAMVISLFPAAPSQYATFPEPAELLLLLSCFGGCWVRWFLCSLCVLCGE